MADIYDDPMDKGSYQHPLMTRDSISNGRAASCNRSTKVSRFMNETVSSYTLKHQNHQWRKNVMRHCSIDSELTHFESLKNNKEVDMAAIGQRLREKQNQIIMIRKI